MSQASHEPRVYLLIFAALVGLTLLTVGLSFVELGPLHTVAGLAIAIAKGALVAVFFMHVPHNDRLSWLVITGGFLWFAILMGLTLADYDTRVWMVY